MDWPDSIVELDESQYESFIRKYPSAIVDFWGPSCAPCKMLSPLMEALASEMKGKVAFGKVDVTKNLKLTSKMMIRSIPTIHYYRDGNKVKESQGFIPRSRLIQEMREILH
ncbi:MAG: thioredoxin domain-containing protein [Candidatus Thermoplasmatota archaeon]|nr:thioredoxin domain-containing protein [Candidatus Thermoplasmatota archaeon]